MAITKLTSKNNPLLKTIRLISSDSRRAPKETVVAEGIRVLEEVDYCRCKIEAVVISENFGSNAREAALLNSWIINNVNISKIGENLFRSISDVQSPQGAIALVQIPERSLEKLSPEENPLILYASDIQDPGNLGTIIRTAAAASASLICTSTGTVSPKNRKCIRASAGACFRFPIVEHTHLATFLDYCEFHKIKVYRTDARNGLAYTEADLASPCAIMLGNEGHGISDERGEKCQGIRIPMAEGIESLNVAMAAAIILFEALRQRSGL